MNTDYTFSNKLQIHEGIVITKHECDGNHNGQIHMFTVSPVSVWQLLMQYDISGINNKCNLILNKNLKCSGGRWGN